MRNLNFLKLFYGLMLVMVSTAFVSCVDDNDDTEAPYLEVSPTTLIFGLDGQPANGSQASFDISTNRSWKATVKDDKSWVTLSKYEGEGSATIQVSIPENINDEASVVIEISNKVGVLMSETVKISSGSVGPTEVIYNETVGDKAVSNPYPYVDSYDGWNKSGVGSANVTYSGASASVRASGLANSGAYEGASGPNVVFFGTLPAYFQINKIALTDAQTNLKLTFGASYSIKVGDDYDNTFDISKLTVSLSADGTNWIPLTYTKNNGDSEKPYWVLATANFTLKKAVSELYIKYTALAASSIRLDDITLATGAGGTEIDLGNGGGDPSEATAITIPELISKMTAEQTILDNNADRYLTAIVQSDVEGGNYTNNNLVVATENATTAGNGIMLYGSQVDPKELGLKKGDKIKVTLHKGKAQIVNYQGVYEVTGAKTEEWATVEKEGTATITPIEITPNDLINYQSMTVKIKKATPQAAGIWGINSPYTFTSGGQEFAVFCKSDAAAFMDQPFAAVESDITGIVTVYKEVPQLAPRNMEDVAGFASTTPTITSATPTSLSFPATGGSKDIEIGVVNMGSNTLSHGGLSGILSATINGTKVTVNAEANTTAKEIEQTLKVSLTNGNSIDIPITVAAPSTGGGYSLISTLEELTAGKYFMAGYVELNNDKVDLTPYNYQLWTGEVSYTGSGTSSNSDLVTVSYQFKDNEITPQEASKTGTEMELVAVTGKPNTYYIKVGDKYLYNSVATTNRRLYLKDTAEDAEWVFMDKSNGTGVTASNNNTYLITASATYNYIRSYKTETQTKTGIFFFKKN